MQKETILIVGGAGYIGSYVNKMLDKAGCSTVVLDNLCTGSLSAVPCGTFIKGDIGDKECLDAIFTSHTIKAVMHFAGFIDVSESVADPILYYKNNVTNTLQLLDCMLQHHVKVFIFSSSAAVYGAPKEQKISERDPTYPISPYGRTKLMVESILQDFASAYDMRFSCLRYFNAAGADPEGQLKLKKKKESNLIPILLRSLKYGDGTITIHGSDYPTTDGTCVRDFVHLHDLGSAHISALEQLLQGSPSSQYNLGNGRGFSVREVIDTAGKVTGICPKLHIGPRRRGDPAVLLASSEKAKKELNWRPVYPDLETMVHHAWRAI